MPSTGDADELQSEAFGVQAGVAALIQELANDNHALAGVLETAMRDLANAAPLPSSKPYGRRLFERAIDDDHVNLRKAHVSSELMRDGPLVGVTLAACAALCESLRRNDTNNDPRGECQSYAFRRLYPDDDASQQVECHLLYHTGLCTPVDFAASIYGRKYTSSGTCKNPTTYANPFCLELAASRGDARVMDYESSHTLCKRKPHTAPASGGKLPTPRSALEAMNMVGLARAQGVYAFWTEKPPYSSRTRRNLHWADSNGNTFYYEANETRCVLVDTLAGHASSHMFARLEPCASRRADGLVCEAAGAAPPPPPDIVGHWRAPQPPPPPAIRERSLRHFVNKEVRPRTRALCSSATEGRSHRAACLEFAEMLSQWRISGFISGMVGFCEPHACWHSCDGATAMDSDGWHACKFAECADSPCLSFLLQECEAGLHDEIRRMFDGACKLVPPSPPEPPSPPPCPPFSPPPPIAPPPPPVVVFSQRVAAEEVTFDPDCEPVSYEECRLIQQEYHDANPTSPNTVAATLAACENADGEEHCFRGCAYGGAVGNGAIYTHLLPRHEAEFGAYNPKRCATSLLPYCACKVTPPPPPAVVPPPPGQLDIQDYEFVRPRASEQMHRAF